MANSSAPSGLNGQLSSCFQRVEASQLTDVILVIGAVAMLVIGILGTLGTLNAVTNATYLSYGMYAGSALLALAEIVVLVRRYYKGAQKNEPISDDQQQTNKASTPIVEEPRSQEGREAFSSQQISQQQTSEELTDSPKETRVDRHLKRAVSKQITNTFITEELGKAIINSINTYAEKNGQPLDPNVAAIRLDDQEALKSAFYAILLRKEKTTSVLDCFLKYPTAALTRWSNAPSQSLVHQFMVGILSKALEEVKKDSEVRSNPNNYDYKSLLQAYLSILDDSQIIDNEAINIKKGFSEFINTISDDWKDLKKMALTEGCRIVDSSDFRRQPVTTIREVFTWEPPNHCPPDYYQMIACVLARDLYYERYDMNV